MNAIRYIKTFVETFRQTIREEGMEGYSRYYGHYRARVSNVDDPEGRDRIKIEVFSFGLPEGREELVAWALPVGSTMTAGKDTGASFTPEVGQMVWVSFEFGDINQPCYHPGGWYAEGEMPADLSDPTSRGFVSPKGHKFVLKDKDGQEEVVLQHKDGQAVEFRNDKSLVVSANGHSMTIDTSSIVIKHQTGTQVKMTATDVEVSGNAGVTLKAPRVVVDGSVSIELGAGASSPVVKGTGLIAYLLQDLIWKSTHFHEAPKLPPTVPPPPLIPTQILSLFVRTK